jgi:hypothetical protein
LTLAKIKMLCLMLDARTCTVIFHLAVSESSQAWVTLATNDSYSLGALVLAHALKRVGTTRKLVVMVTSGVTMVMQ